MAITNQQLHSEIQDLKMALKEMPSRRELDFHHDRILSLEKWRDEAIKQGNTTLQTVNTDIQTVKNQVGALQKDLAVGIKILSVIGTGFLLSLIGFGLNYFLSHIHFF